MTRVAKARYVCLAVVLLLLGEALGPVRAVLSAPTAGAERTENLDVLIAIQERARQTLDRQIEQYNETARKKAQEAKGLLGRITKLRQEEQMSGARIELLELQSKRLQDSARELNEDVARIDRSMKNLVEALRHRLLDIYKYDARAELNLLLSTEDTHEAMIMSYMLDRLSRQDRVILEELGEKIRELEGAKVNLEKNRAQLARQSEELKEERVRHNAAITQANALLQEVLLQRRKAEEAAREMEAAQREVGQKIIDLLHRRQSEGGRPRTPDLPGKTPPTSPTPSAPRQEEPPRGPEPKQQDYTYLARGARLEWPIRGPVITLFGSRNHPVFRTKVFNSGIDIRAAAGAPVKAAGPGEVLFSGWLRGFGQVVIVNHGDNLTTVYAHLDRTSVSEGDAVRMGSLLGTVGNTGTSGEYSLHFEVRQGGTAKDPMNYLRRL